MGGFIGFANTVGSTTSTASSRTAAGKTSGKDETAQTVIENMSQAIAHRGPDRAGTHVDEHICLGTRRLGLIDCKDAGAPLYNEDRTKVIACDGEIYNYHELREELIAAGHTFATHTDDEVILHGYEQWGADALLARLRGLFAFVIWDTQAHTLFGARDPYGAKPFYYYQSGDRFLFASELKAFLSHPQFDKRFNEGVLANYLSFQYTAPTRETFFQDTYKVLPAHYFTWKPGSAMLHMSRYWRPDFAPVTAPLATFAQRIDDAVNESVATHLMGKDEGIEIGSFLSSGVDSSYVASAAKVDKTFTVSFVSQQYNEIDYAKEFSALIGATNYSKEITPQEYWDQFAHIQYCMDEPLADPAAIALYFVSRLAKEHVPVVFSGEGADELFGGYKVYREPLVASWYSKVPFVLRRAIGALASCLPPMRGRNLLVRRGRKLEQWFIGNADIFSVGERTKLLKTGADAPTPQQITAPVYAEAVDYDAVTKMQYLDINLWQVGDILLKADRMSMAHSLVVRMPLLDREIVKLAQTLPLACKVDAVHTKKAFRAAAIKTIPPFTANKDKLGFPVPLRVWLREDAYYQRVKTVFTSQTADRFFHTEMLVRLLDEHRASVHDNSRKIWTVYTFLIWYDEYFVKR